MAQREVEQALAPFKGESGKALARALEAYLAENPPSEEGGFLVLDPDAVAGSDSTQESRLVYVSSLLRLRDYLWQTPSEMKEAEGQAKLALGYIKHIESTGLKHLQLGRSVRDDKLASEVAKLRAENAELANRKAEIIVKQRRQELEPGQAPAEKKGIEA